MMIILMFNSAVFPAHIFDSYLGILRLRGLRVLRLIWISSMTICVSLCVIGQSHAQSDTELLYSKQGRRTYLRQELFFMRTVVDSDL